MSSYRVHRSLPKVALHWVLVVPFVVQIVGAVGLVGYLSYRSGQQVVCQLANHLLEEVTKRISDRLDQDLLTPQQVVAAKELAPVYTRQIRAFLTQLNFSPSGQALILRRSGQAVATSKEALQPSLAPQSSLQSPPFSGQPGQPHELVQHIEQHLGNLDRLQTPQPLSAIVNQQTYFMLVTPYQEPHGLNWLIVTVVPEADFIGEIDANVQRTILLCILTLLSATTTGILTAYWIAKPIQRLSRASQSLAEGKWQALNADSQIQEFAVLTQSFNHTAAQLQSSFDRIKLALQESESKFTKVFRNCPDPIAITSIEDGGQYLEVNDSFLAFSEYSQEEVIGRTSAELGLSVDPQQELDLASQLLTDGRVKGFEYSYRTKSGRLGTTLLSIELIELDGQLRALTVATDITERQQAEQALRESEARFHQIADAAPGEIYILVQHLDGSYEFEYMSRGCQEIQELSSEQVLANPQLSFAQVHPDDRTLMYAAAARSAETLEPFTQAWRIITPSGKLKWVQLSSRPERRENGDTVWYGVLQDITKRKQAELELHHQQALRDAIFNESTDAIFLVDPETLLITDCNRQALTLFEVDCKADLIGTEGRALQRRPFTEAEIADIVAEMRLKGFWSLELEFVSHKGNLFWGSLAAKPMRIAEQTINLVRVSDITDRKRAEEIMKRQLTAIEAAIEGIAILEQGTYSYLNQAHLELFGYHHPNDLLGKSWRCLYPDPEIQRFEQEILPSLRQQRSWQGEVTALRQDGSSFAEGLSLTLTENDILICVCRDVSDRHRLDRIKDEFISIVSHELRTPLTAIRGSLGILATGVLDDEPETAQRMLQVALNNSDRLVRLVNDILDLERLESGTVQLSLSACNVTELLEQAVESVHTIAAQAQITIHLSPISAQVWAAPDAIVQTLTNLLSNAIKFSPPNSTVWVKATAIEDEATPTTSRDRLTTHTWVLFSIQDQGRGIPAEKLENIFGRFQQVDVSDSRQKGGTGLGLAICRSIIHQHGGKIWAESTLDVGSIFYFTLPITIE
ncbi:PAS domain S-box protein [Pantanalinema rosaneae CENA516]|uniref:PAS domain S-box protein n=1 Tax=Pantanalinema rosaneae TaxID=1620701 RepID=UPI003D6DC482